MRVAIIGCGNVGSFFYETLQEKSNSCLWISARKLISKPLYVDADMILYCVNDNYLASVASRVSAPKTTLHLHTSGTLAVDIFDATKEHTGVIYPLQTFTKTCPMSDKGNIPFFVELRNKKDWSFVKKLLSKVSSQVYPVTYDQRRILHLCGVFVNNFPNLMYLFAERLLSKTDFDFSVLYPIIEQTVYKLRFLSPHEAQTGPARRHNTSIIHQHLALLQKENTEMYTVYKILSDAISDLYRE